MKLIFAVINSNDTNDATEALTNSGFGVTKLSSTGGFLKKGNTTLMLGVEDDKVETVIAILKEKCAQRMETEVSVPYIGTNASMYHVTAYPVEVQAGGAVVFSVDVSEFWRF